MYWFGRPLHFLQGSKMDNKIVYYEEGKVVAYQCVCLAWWVVKFSHYWLYLYSPVFDLVSVWTELLQAYSYMHVWVEFRDKGWGADGRKIDEEGGEMKRRGRKRRERKTMLKESEGPWEHPSILFFNPTFKCLLAPPLSPSTSSLEALTGCKLATRLL